MKDKENKKDIAPLGSTEELKQATQWEMSKEDLRNILRSTREQNQYLSLEDIIECLNEVFDDEELFIISNSLKK